DRDDESSGAHHLVLRIRRDHGDVVRTEAGLHEALNGPLGLIAVPECGDDRGGREGRFAVTRHLSSSSLISYASKRAEVMPRHGARRIFTRYGPSSPSGCLKPGSAVRRRGGLTGGNAWGQHRRS